jgi:hypothetical protein
MLTTSPFKMGASAGVATKTPFISFASSQLAGVSNVPSAPSFGARFSVFVAVLMALFALCGARVF